MDQIEIPKSPTTASAGLQALLGKVVDYAGMFPPASLPLSRALEQYADYRSSVDRWMLARLVCSVQHLEKMRDHTDLFTHPPFRFSVLPTGGETTETFLEAFGRDVEAIRRFHGDHPKNVRVEQLEARLPRSLLATDVITVRRFLNALDEALEHGDLSGLDFFLEIPLDENLRQTLPILTGAAAARNRDRTDSGHGRIGVKMRTGGTEADAFPDSEQVAVVIAGCRSVGVPFKSTAGLHHPVRHFNETVGTYMHGFLNVTAAAVLAYAHGLDERRIIDVLADHDPSQFRFTDTGMGWSDLNADVTVIDRARREGLVSFGSCSFREPLDDLRNLGLLGDPPTS